MSDILPRSTVGRVQLGCVSRAQREDDIWGLFVGERTHGRDLAPVWVAPVHVEALLHDFAIHQRRRNLAAGTISYRRQRVLSLERWLEVKVDCTVLEATTELIERWLDDTDPPAGTRYTYIANVAAFFKWAAAKGHIPHDPAVEVQRPKLPKRLPRPTPTGDLAHALAYADPRMKAWLLLGAYQGFRCGEMARLRGEDIDAQRMTITARGKGNKERTVALHADTLAALRVYGLPARGPVFTSRVGGGALRPASVSRCLSAYLDSIGTAHQLRHWFGTEVYEKSGGDLLLTQQALGHASPATTAIYAEVSGERARSVIGNLGLGATPTA